MKPRAEVEYAGRQASVIVAWRDYCWRFGHNPYALVGMRYPGLEDAPMTKTLADDVLVALGGEQSK